LNFGKSKKVIFFLFLFISFVEPGNTSEVNKINKDIVASQSSPKISKNKKLFNTSFNQNSKNPLLVENFSENNLEQQLVDIDEKQGELIIESDKQSEINDVIYAEGNVFLSYKGKIIKADNLIYDKLDKKINAEGNITLVFGEQILKMSQLEYTFKDETGYLLDVKGSINSDTLMSDMARDFYNSDIQKPEYSINLQKKEVLNTPNKVNNWIFFTDKITIDGKKWKSDKAIFSNDILEFKQVKIEINSLEAFSLKEELRFKSSLNYLVLDENIAIPFWLGNRAVAKSGKDFDSKSSWTIGYENLDKDGLFIGRNFNSITFGDNFLIDIEPQFLIQRALTGETNSFVKEGDLTTGEKVKRDAEIADFFGFKSQIKGKFNNWDLELDNQVNSLDTNKLSDALRSKAILNKEVDFLNVKWNKSFYGVYRDRVWNGSLGEAEIYLGYGSKLEKKHTWEVNGTTNTEVLSLGLAHLKAEELSSKNLEDSLKGSLFYSLDKNIPLNVSKSKNKIIDSSYVYTYEPIKKGLSLNTRMAALYSLYNDGNHQEYIGFGLGPELVFGDFKAKTFDYTRISIFPFYKFKNGDSIFKFDQISERFTLNIGFDQQLFGPIILKSNGTLNLDGDSDDYGEFIDSKISLNWKKRSYEFGLFYQPHSQAGGISFSLFGFQ